MDDAKTIGLRIRAIRKRRLLTQKQLAERTGNSARMIQHHETGKSMPKADRLKVIADALEIDVSELYRPVDAPIPRRKNHMQAHQ
jgi:transcriptional regulator with XRE-family HTH domain